MERVDEWGTRERMCYCYYWRTQRPRGSSAEVKEKNQSVEPSDSLR